MSGRQLCSMLVLYHRRPRFHIPCTGAIKTPLTWKDLNWEGMLHATWMSLGVQGETLFLSDKITHTKGWGLQSLSNWRREQSRQGLRYGKRPPFSIFTPRKKQGKISKGGKERDSSSWENWTSRLPGDPFQYKISWKQQQSIVLSKTFRIEGINTEGMWLCWCICVCGSVPLCFFVSAYIKS